MKKNFIFLLMAASMTSIQCTHNYYYGTANGTTASSSEPSGGTSGNGGSTGNPGNSGGSGSNGGTGNPGNSGNGGTTSGTGSSNQGGGSSNGGNSGSGSGTAGGSTAGSGSGSSGSGTSSTPGRPTTTQAATQAPPKQLLRTWMHSHEEDQGDVKVYRPDTFAFPRSRGRTGFVFEKNGKFTQYDIAPTDGTETNQGTWTMRGKIISISSIKDQPAYTLEMVSVDDNMLKVKRK